MTILVGWSLSREEATACGRKVPTEPEQMRHP
jgi:hypothetical protein